MFEGPDLISAKIKHTKKIQNIRITVENCMSHEN